MREQQRPRLGVFVVGWGNPFVWIRSRKDDRGAQEYDLNEPSDWFPGKMALEGYSCEEDLQAG